MTLDELLVGLSLVFVIEGLLPFIAPARWKSAMQQASGIPDETLRMIGLGSMVVGIVLLTLLRNAG